MGLEGIRGDKRGWDKRGWDRIGVAMAGLVSE